MKKVLSLFMCSVLAFVAFCTANVKAEDTVSLTVHYQKFEGAYEGAAFYGWNGGIGAAGLYHFTETDDFGAVKTVELAADTSIATSGAGEFIVFHSQVTEDIATDGNQPASWTVLDNVKSTGGNIKFDGAAFAAAWATGEVHLWYYEGMVLENGYNVTVSDGTADAKAAAAFEAVKYHEVTVDETTTTYGYAKDGFKTLKLVMAQGTGNAFFDEDGNAAWDLYSWGSAQETYPLATVMPASVSGIAQEYAIFYGWVPNAYTGGAGFIPRSAGGWVWQTGDFKEETAPGFDAAFVAVPENGVLTCSVLFDSRTTDFRVGGEAVAAWMNEINAFLIDSAEFINITADEEGNYTTTLMFTVNKDLPVADLTADGVSKLDELITVTCGETTLEVVETSFDLAANTVKKFRVVVDGKVDTAAEYTLAMAVTTGGNNLAAETAIACDNEAPTINLLKDKEQIAICAGAGTVALPRISVTDTVDGDLSKYWTIDATKNVTVDTSKAGSYVITIVCQDSMGNVATKDFTFEVVDVDAGQSNANAGLALLALLPVAVVGLVATRKFAM
jgi:hypothetical protein